MRCLQKGQAAECAWRGRKIGQSVSFCPVKEDQEGHADLRCLANKSTRFIILSRHVWLAERELPHTYICFVGKFARLTVPLSVLENNIAAMFNSSFHFPHPVVTEIFCVWFKMSPTIALVCSGGSVAKASIFLGCFLFIDSLSSVVSAVQPGWVSGVRCPVPSRHCQYFLLI